MALFGASALALVCLRFLESLPPQRRAPLNVGSVTSTWASIVAHPTFRANAALTVATYGGQFTFLATSSFVFLQAFGIGAWVGWHMDGSVFVLVNGVWFWSACVAAVAWTLFQRDGELARN